MLSIAWIVSGPLIYFAVIFFLVKTAATFIKYARLPRHLRWDLYPVPHQGPEGSKYQKVDFADMKPHISLFHELKEMSQEMLFIKKAFINNRKVWLGSFPLHAGLYLGIVWILMLVAGALMELGGIQLTSATSSFAMKIMWYVTIAAGAGSFIAGLAGSLVLLWLRITDEDMRVMSDIVSFLNLGLMIALFGSGLVAWGLADPAFQLARQHTAGLLTLRPSAVAQPLIVVQIVIFCIFLVYLPFSRMMHFIGKYFFYHNIIWDDEMMKRNSAMENDVASYLGFRMTWSAPHIKKGGTWVDQVSGDEKKEEEKR